MTTQTAKPLTERQQKTLALLRAHAAKPVAALGLRDIMREVGYGSTSVVSNTLKTLEEAGYIRLHQMKANQIELVQRGPAPAQQINSLLALIHEAARDLERWAADNADDPAFANDLTGMAEGLRAGAAEAIGAQP